VIDPYAFVRAVTIGLGLIWTVSGLVRTVGVARRWRARLSVLGLDDRWWRRQVSTAVVRATVLDPVNLALLCTLLALWSVRLVTE